MRAPRTIFLPVLHLMAVLLLSQSQGKLDLVVYYHGLPRYMGGICRVLGLAPERLARAVARLTRLRIQKTPNYDEITRFHQIYLSCLERITEIARELLPWAEASPWMGALTDLVGAIPARAYTAKCLGLELLPPVLSVTAAIEALNNTGLTVVWDPSWPPAWEPILQRHLEDPEVVFFVWPEWYRRWLGFWARVKVLGQLPALAAWRLWRRGVVRGEVPKCEVKVITEFIDPKRLQGTAYDADYWIDGQRINKEDVLFFLRHRQLQILQKDGYNLADLFKLFDQKGYQLKLLDGLPYPAGTLRRLWSLYVKAVQAILCSPDAYLGRVLVGAWRDYLEFVPLFAHFAARHLIYLTFPNGHGAVRWDDAILTGLCRQNGIKSVGCQTRSLYARKFEDFFDCFDLYLSWGPAWREKLPGRLDFVEQAMDVGCIYLDHLLSTLGRWQQKLPAQERILVAIFDSDIAYNHHYTKNYVISFLKSCAVLARRYPDCHFLVKNKEPQDAATVMEDGEFRRLWEEVRGNFEFAGRQRYDYAEIMAQADIVIALAFTTPGVEGLVLGKPALYYSELQCGGQAFSGSGDLVAHNYGELEQWFARALEQVKQGYTPNARVLDGLSAFRDGRARSRIIGILEG